MKIITVNNASDFDTYDSKVQKGKWMAHTSKKAKPPIRTNEDGHSYKVYDHTINLADRVTKGVVCALSLLILMPLWSKNCRRLWNETITGREKVKVVAVTKHFAHTQITKITDCIKQCVTSLLDTCKVNLLDVNAKPASLSIFLQFKVDSRIVNKQFIFEGTDKVLLNKNEISQKIENYLKEIYLNGKNLDEFEFHVMGLATNQECFYEWEKSISSKKTDSDLGFKETAFGGSAPVTDCVSLVHANTWIKKYMPHVTNLYKDNKFVKIDSIYQSLDLF